MTLTWAVMKMCVCVFVGINLRKLKCLFTGNCSFQKKHWVRNHERLDKACEDNKGYGKMVIVLFCVNFFSNFMFLSTKESRA